MEHSALLFASLLVKPFPRRRQRAWLGLGRHRRPAPTEPSCSRTRASGWTATTPTPGTTRSPPALRKGCSWRHCIRRGTFSSPLRFSLSYGGSGPGSDWDATAVLPRRSPAVPGLVLLAGPQLHLLLARRPLRLL